MEKAKILIVDDLEENLYSLEQILEAEDREIISALSGNEALKLARQHEFALVLTDVQMPEMDGFEFVEILRMGKNTKYVPVIFVTAISKEKEYVIKGYSEGAVDYLYKPLDPDIVAAKVDIFVTLYNQKRELQAQNEELDRLNALKNKFLGMAAHDIRNPLSIIEFYSRTLIDELKDELKDPTQLQDLENIYVSSKFAQNLVNELLDISKIESGNIELEEETVEFRSFLEDCIKLNNIFAEKKDIRLKGNFDFDKLETSIDKNKMNQVMNNLITNAVKFSHKNTEIEVTCKADDNHVTIAIQDQGQGIPSDEIEKLFVPFAKTSVKSTGGEKSTGLGLSIVKKIIEAHDAEINVSSEVGVGTCFEIKLPINESKTAVAETKSKDDVTPIDGEDEYKIVVVDDDMMMRSLSTRAFSQLGRDVTCLEGGIELLEQFDDLSPDIIFTDLNMPEIDGYQLVKKLRENGIKTPIFGLTGFVNDEIIKKSEEAGMNNVYEKPLEKNALRLVFEQVIS